MVACRHRFLKSLAFRVPAGGGRGWCEDGGSPAHPVSGPAPRLRTPTLPAWVSLGVLQGLGGSGKGDTLEDVHRIAEEAQLLVDAFHEAALRVHGAQLGWEVEIRWAQAGCPPRPLPPTHPWGGGSIPESPPRDSLKEGPPAHVA